VAKRDPRDTLSWLGQTLYALGMAVAMDAAPFHFNPHRLPYTHYQCVKCWARKGTRAPCEHRSK
jgi:hypothetical protein